MTETKDIFLNKEIRCGGFYELCIQVCSSLDVEPIKKYLDYIKSLENIDGPFNENFELTESNIENFEHQWILNLKDVSIPFKTFNIREDEPIESGFNWFNISFYTATIEKIFGEEYQTWSENPKYPTELVAFLHKTVTDLNKIYPFQLAMLDFEISGQYYLADLSTDLSAGFENWAKSKFFVNSKNYNSLSERNKNLVEIIKE